MAVDDTDKAVLKLLESDARMANSELARRLGVSESNVRHRLKRLFSSGAVRRGIIVDFSVLGIETVASMKLRFRADAVDDAIRTLSLHPATGLVMQITGNFHVFMIVAVRSTVALHEFVENEVRRIDGFLSMDLSIFADATKFDARLVPLKILDRQLDLS